MDGFDEELLNALIDVVRHGNWCCVGEKRNFKPGCTKLYSEDGEHVVLVRTEDGRFWAMDSSCPHEGGPLELGDIEDLGNGKLALICPWHHFDFCLETGISSTGLENQVYEVRVVQEKVYINTQNMLSLSPTSEDSSVPSGTLSLEAPGSTPSENSLCFWATKILCTPDPKEKVTLTQEVQERWNSGKITEVGEAAPPAQPWRKDNLTVVDPKKMKRGKGGTLASRIALLHSLANMEQWAIDLSWDTIARFSNFRLSTGDPLPLQFFNDFVKVAGDEAKHYNLVEERITEMGSYFGALPVHHGRTAYYSLQCFSDWLRKTRLWQSAKETSHSLLARLAVMNMVHEARGLDVHPQTMSRFAAQGDDGSVRALEVIYSEEITHVAAGMRWFTYICTQQGMDCLATFHEMVRRHFRGYLKPPFNTEGRKLAGMTEEWYVPLVRPSS